MNTKFGKTSLTDLFCLLTLCLVHPLLRATSLLLRNRERLQAGIQHVSGSAAELFRSGYPPTAHSCRLLPFLRAAGPPESRAGSRGRGGGHRVPLDRDQLPRRRTRHLEGSAFSELHPDQPGEPAEDEGELSRNRIDMEDVNDSCLWVQLNGFTVSI